MRIADYAFGTPGANALHNAGYSGVMRYASAGRTDVNIKGFEYLDLIKNNMFVGIIDEHAADYMLGGSTSGAFNALASRDITRAVGIPDGVIYFAADWDATLGGAPISTNALNNMRAIQSFLEGARDKIGADNVGLYAGFYVVAWVSANMPWVKWFWQTEAWSSGNVHNKTNILQRARNEWVNTVQVDINDTLTDNFGQRGQTNTPPNPPPPINTWEVEFDMARLPVLQRGMKNGHVVTLQFLLNQGAQNRQNSHVSTDGDFGPATENALRQYQSATNIGSDGICGLQTYTKLLGV